MQLLITLWWSRPFRRFTDYERICQSSPTLCATVAASNLEIGVISSYSTTLSLRKPNMQVTGRVQHATHTTIRWLVHQYDISHINSDVILSLQRGLATISQRKFRHDNIFKHTVNMCLQHATPSNRLQITIQKQQAPQEKHHKFSLSPALMYNWNKSLSVGFGWCNILLHSGLTFGI